MTNPVSVAPIRTPITMENGSIHPLWVQWFQLLYKGVNVGTVAWGGITGSIASQGDLQAALDAKLDDSQASAYGLTLLAAVNAAAARALLGISGTVQTVSGQVDFGYATGGEGNFATVTVAAPWVTPTSTIICSPLSTATADHAPDDYALEGLKAYATNIVNGVGFDIVAVADYATWGKYNVQAIGV